MIPTIQPGLEIPKGGLFYRPDLPEVAERMAKWWRGELDRPALEISGLRTRMVEPETDAATFKAWVGITPSGSRVPRPERGAQFDMDYRLKIAHERNSGLFFWGEAVPGYACDIGINMLDFFLGCGFKDTGGTLWIEPCIGDAPESTRFELDEHNPHYQFLLALVRAVRERFADKFRPFMPQFDCGLDTLAAMRGTETLLLDCYDRPEWVRASALKIAELCMRLYEVFYPLCRDSLGGTSNIAYAPGGVSARLQCDFSAMLSPALFREFQVPALEAICNRYPYSAYHWDGPAALVHHDELLKVKNLKMLQFTPGAGNPREPDRRWWPYYHRTLDAGKKMHIRCWEVDEVAALKAEFGAQFRHCYIPFHAKDEDAARRVIDLVTGG